MPRNRASSLSRLDPRDDDDNLRVVVETPKGTRTKLVYDPDAETFCAKKILPEGMSFPFNFGFVPSTKAEDDDPLDVLVIMSETVPPGTLVSVRLVGVIEAVQTEDDGSSERNDRLIAVACACDQFRDVEKLSELPDAMVDQIEHFFVTYNEEEGRQFEPKGRRGPKSAEKILEKGLRKDARKS